jgi:hypothetical protein
MCSKLTCVTLLMILAITLLFLVSCNDNPVDPEP